MLSCKDISDLASNYIDKNLSPLKQLKVKMHLMMCNKCRHFVNQLSTTVNTLKGLNTPLPEDKIIDEQTEKLMNISKSLKPNRPNTSQADKPD